MAINLQITNFEKDLSRMEVDLEQINMESVKERTLKRVANELSEMARQSIVAEADIISPAMNSPFERGDGPSLATGDAWLVTKVNNNRYRVHPHPLVRQRAIVLNSGYPGTITPNNADYLRFEVNGVPMYRKEVEGPDATGYWQAALRRLKQSNKLEEIADEELSVEFEEAF